MEDPLSREAWRERLSRAHRAQRRGSADSYIYVQVTRGAEYGRNHAPLPDVPRTVFAFAAPWPDGRAGWQENGLPAVTAARHALGALRHQVRVAARQRAAAPARGG